MNEPAKEMIILPETIMRIGTFLLTKIQNYLEKDVRIVNTYNKRY